MAMNKHIIDDAKRCLQCKDPSCMKGCPVSTPIKEAIQLLLNHEIEKAGELLFTNNPLSIICSHICPQENQCEGHCVRGAREMPVHISAIEQYISDFYLNIHTPNQSTKEAGNVAIIGSGPAGITIALLLSQRNYNVTIFEGNDQIGGILRYGIPEFRLPKNTLDSLKNVLLSSGVKIKPNSTIGINLSIDDLFRDGFHAVFVGTGVWRPAKLGVKGETLAHVHFAIEYLRNPNVYNLGKRVLVIGAGNVAMDVARTAIRKGSREVHIVCNKGEETITALQEEVKHAKIDGVRFIYFKTAVEFVEAGAVLADSMIMTDESGKQKAVPKEGTEELFEADSIIVAIGQGPRAFIISSTEGINVNSRGLVTVDDGGRTSRDGIFASGDVVTGARTVVEAVKASRRVADAIDNYVKEIRSKEN